MTSARLEGIDACVFDAYGTLFDVASAANRLAPQLGDKAAPLAALWRTKQLEYTWLRSLMGAFSDFWHVTGDALDYAMRSLDLEDTALRSRLMELYLELGAYPEVEGCLKAIKDDGRRTAILTNGSMTMVVAAVRTAGLYPLLDALISVDPLKVFKPHPSVYQRAVDTLGVAPERICFLSSNAWDAAGAAHFGFRVVWINRFGQAPEGLPGRPEYEIRRLDELPPLLGIG